MKKVKYKRAWQCLASVILVLSILLLCTHFRIVIIRGNSMNPTFANGDIILAQKAPCSIHVGSVVVFTINKTTYVKRVVALGGDMVEVNEQLGILRVNGEEVISYDGYDGGESYEVAIPKDKYFVVGDNYNDSVDSRDSTIGLIDYTDIQAVLLKS